MKRFATGVLLLLCLALFASFPADGGEGKRTGEKEPIWVEGEVIVTWRTPQEHSSLQAAGAGGGSVQEISGLSREWGKTVAVVKIPGKSTEELLRSFSSDPGVERVSPNYILRIFSPVTPNDPRFSSQWGLSNTGQNSGRAGADIDAPTAWGIRTSALTAKVVAIIDTGITKNHEDLKDNLWTGPGGIHGRNCVYDNDDPEDDHGHGTHVAGIIGAKGNNGIGTAGVAWNVKLMAVKAFNSQGTGKTSDELEAYGWILQKKREGVDIVAVNASYGGPGFSGEARQAIQDLGNAGILFVAAAGNYATDNDQSPEYPASYGLPNIISVASTDRNDALSDFSNYGRTSVHLAAPGTDIWSTWTPSYTPSAGDIFFDDMQSGDGKWTTSAEHYSPQVHWMIVDSTRDGRPTKVWTDEPEQHTIGNQKTYLTVRDDIDLSGRETEPLVFGMQIRPDLENGADFLRLEFSPDSGTTWTTVHSFTGGGDEWTSFSTPIPGTFRTDRFRFRFVFETGLSSTGYGGVEIDDVGIGRGVWSYMSGSGTSMATPFVTGAAALVSSQFPGESMDRIRSRILGGVDRLSSLSGKVSTGGRLNLARSLGAAVPDDGSGGGCSVTGIPSLLFLLPLLLLVRK